ncbi:MAG: GDP-mannose 4,6-dehydratase [Candidatus Omnitrophica bacterium]|nr:GDP-mannose 4,6-dehydratase [Candidatus Omnitrophota bacterium]
MPNKFWENKKVLITGHEGFLGSWLARALLKRGAAVIGVDKVINRPISILEDSRRNIICVKGDVADMRLINRIIARHKPEVIFHLAAEAIVGEANKKPVKAFKSNIEGTWNILEASRNKKFIEAVVIASSDKAYGAHKKLPYTEEASLKGAHPYDVSKSCADLLAYTYFNTYNVPVCITRCGNIYGEGDFHFSRLVPDAIRCAITNETLLIRSDGKFIRDYVYIGDIVNGYIMLAERMVKKGIYGEAFNFSNEDPISVLGLTKKIYRSANKKLNCKVINKARYEIKKQYLSAKKARRVLGWKPVYSLDRGLTLTINWYKKIFRQI